MTETKQSTSNNYPELFQPLKIGPVEIKNRFAMSATCLDAIEPGGFVGDRIIYFFAARARGGTGLIFTLPAEIEPNITSVKYMNPWLYNSLHLPGWSELAETIHAWGAKSFVEVSPGGPGRLGALLGDGNALAPSPVPIHMDPELVVSKKARKLWEKRGLNLEAHYHIQKVYPMPKEITVEEIHKIEDQVANAVYLSEHAGFDGAEVHTAHGVLGANFLSPHTNLRKDEYGGSMENRTRFTRNILERARKKISKNFALGIRISAAEHVPGGLAAEETAEICKYLEPYVDFFDLSNGVHHESHTFMIPDEDGTVIEEGAVIKRAVKVPVITPSIHNPELGSKAILGGKTDMMASSRQLIVDPDYPNKVREGKPYRKCIKCLLGCTGRIDIGLPLRCELNPNVLLEYRDLELDRRNAPIRKTFTIR
jgi:2,4-dienoyl-CoA reductase-like NADH-dependent reductase (Old Yellow Enzyme family)